MKSQKNGPKQQQHQILTTSVAVNHLEKKKQVIDPVTSLGLLEESYKLMHQSIRAAEKKISFIQILHTALREDFARLPAGTVKSAKYSLFEERQKEEIHSQIDTAWDKFRAILVYAAKI